MKTKPAQSGLIKPGLPLVYDYDGAIFIREYNGGLLFGGFEKEAKPIFHNFVPNNFECQTLQPDLDHFCNYFKK